MAVLSEPAPVTTVAPAGSVAPARCRNGGQAGAPAGTVERASRDRGSTSLTIVLLAPIMTMLMFVGLQAALWNHARTDARVVARDVAGLVARDGMPPADASAAARSALASSDLHDTKVVVSTAAGRVTVSISGEAPGILRGTSRSVQVSVQLPLEGWVPL